MTNDIAAELELLKELKGADFVSKLKQIAARKEFFPVSNEHNIFTVGGEGSQDYVNLLNTARKAVTFGYRVFILPNPKGIRTADYIFEQKGNYKLYELKTPIGKASVGTRLLSSSGQGNRVLLNMPPDYNTRWLAADIKKYFDSIPEALEVLIFKGKKMVSIDRNTAEHPSFYRILKKRYEK